MKSDDGYWKMVPGNLDDWNAKQKTKLAIEQRSKLGEGVQRDVHRVAVSRAGDVIAEECDRLSGTFCLVSTKALR
jgi:hypothetical protein